MLMFCHIPDLVMNCGVCVLILYYVYLTRYFYHLILLLLLALIIIQCRGWTMFYLLPQGIPFLLIFLYNLISLLLIIYLCVLTFQLIICMYRYHQLTVHHATNLVITGTEHLMLIFPIIIHAPVLNLQRSSCLLMLYSVKM